MLTNRLQSWHLGALVFCALVPGVNGHVGWFDAGEFSTAAAGLGVAHPTGFPLFCILGYVAHLVPLGTLSFKIGLLCAASIATTTALLHAIARAHDAKPWSALLGALFYPSVGVVWLHGQVVEVYALNVLMIALLAWCLLAARPRWRTAAFLTGLGLGAHITFALSACFIWVFTLTRHRAWARLPRWIPLGVWGAFILLYLPAAASRDPWLNWGDPSSLSAFWAHLSASGIRDAFQEEMGVIGPDTWSVVGAWFSNGAGELWPMVVMMSFFAGLGARARWVWSLAMVLALADATFSVLMNPMGQADLQTGMPGAWAFALALTCLASGLPSQTWGPRLSAGALALLLIGTSSSWASKPAQEDQLALRYGQSALLELKPNAVALLSSDHLAGQALYLQGMEGLRPDVVPLVTQHLPLREEVKRRYRAARQEPPAAFLKVRAEAQADAVLALARAEVERTSVYWELGDSRFDPLVTPVIRPGDVLYRIAPSQQAARAPLGPLAAPGGAFAQVYTSSSAPAWRSRRVLSDLSRHRGVWHILRDELGAAEFCLEDAYRLDATNAPALLNLAAVRRRQGRLGDAIALLEEALERSPTYTKARRNLALYQAELKTP